MYVYTDIHTVHVHTYTHTDLHCRADSSCTLLEQWHKQEGTRVATPSAGETHILIVLNSHSLDRCHYQTDRQTVRKSNACKINN
jgi:hypothetical protein